MKSEYDFSGAEKGKFYRRDAIFHVPIYLDEDVNEFINKLAEERELEVATLVNQLLRLDMEKIKSDRS
jgi:hypothetical protein